MKKFLTLTIVGIFLTLVAASCGSTKHGGCEAYGSVDQTQNSDLASK